MKSLPNPIAQIFVLKRLIFADVVFFISEMGKLSNRQHV